MRSNNLCEGGHALKIAFGITMLSLLLAGGAGAATWTVEASGGANFTRIQDAIDNASTGDMIIVYSGTYYENVDVNKPLNLKGIDNGGGKPVVKAVRTGRGDIPITLTAGNSTLDGFKTINGYSAGIYVNSNNNFIINNTALNNAVSGISLEEGGNNILSNNIVSYNRFGFFLGYSSNNNILIGNNAFNNKENGILLDISTNNTIYNNFFNNYNNLEIRIIRSNSINKWNITKTPGKNIVGGSYLGGNIWANPKGKGFSQTCEDVNGDGICDSPNTLDISNIDHMSLAYKPVTKNLMDLAFIIITMALIATIYSKRDEMKREITGIIVNTSKDAIKGAIKGIFYGSIVGGLIYFMYGLSIRPENAVLALFGGIIYGVFVGAISGIIGGVSRRTIASAIFGAIGGAIVLYPFFGILSDAAVASIIVIGSTFFGAIIGCIIGEIFFREYKDAIVGAVIGGVIGGEIGGGEYFEGIIGGLIGSVIFGCIIGSLIGGFFGKLISTITENKDAIFKNMFAGSISAAIVVLIAGIIVGPDEALIYSLIVSIISGAIFGWIIGAYFGTYKNMIFLAIFGGAIAGTIVGVVIGRSAIADAILIINSKIYFNNYFGGIVGAIVGWIVGKKPILHNHRASMR